MLAEARALARIRHPNVVPIFGVDEHEGRVGFWTDFVQGTTLEELVSRQGPFGPREAALVGIDVCRATGDVHVARSQRRVRQPGRFGPFSEEAVSPPPDEEDTIQPWFECIDQPCELYEVEVRAGHGLSGSSA